MVDPNAVTPVGRVVAVGRNLSIRPLPDVTQNAEIGREFMPLFRWIEETAIEMYSWYMAEKGRKARVSKALRVLAVVSLTVGSIIPLLSVATNQLLQAEWGFVALAVGAGSLVLDRAFGFSSSWSRYAASAMEIKGVLLMAQISWAEACSLSSDQQPGRQVQCIQELTQALIRIVSDETSRWADDVSDNLTDLRAGLSVGTQP